MAGFKETDQSAAADAFVLAALLLPLFPVVAIIYSATAVSAFGCSAVASDPCLVGGFDLNQLHGQSVVMLKWSVKAAGSNILLVYIVLLALLAQFTIQGLRGRVVRTCAVIMSASVVPLILGIAEAITRVPERVCGGGPCEPATLLPTMAHLGFIFFEWLTNIAVPLGVLVSLLVAMTMGYRLLIGRFVGLLFRRN